MYIQYTPEEKKFLMELNKTTAAVLDKQMIDLHTSLQDINSRILSIEAQLKFEAQPKSIVWDEDKKHNLLSTRELNWEDKEKIAELKKLKHSLLSEFSSLTKDRENQLEQAELEIERKHFEKLSTSSDSVLMEGKRQIPLLWDYFINSDCIEEIEETEELIELIDETYNPLECKLTISIKHTKLEYQTFDLSESKSVIPRYKYYPNTPLYNTSDVISFMHEELSLFFEYLDLHDGEKREELARSISKFFRQVPFVSSNIQAQRKSLIEPIEKREPLAEINYLSIMRDKVNKNLISELQPFQDGSYKTIVKVKDSHIPVALTYNGDNNISFSRPYDAFKDAIVNTLGSQGFANMVCNPETPGYPYYISLDEIWRKMTGITDPNKHPSQEARKQLKDKINEMRVTDVLIDSRDEIKKFNLPMPDGGILARRIIQDNLLNARWTKAISTTGFIFDVLKVKEAPIVYQYNQEKNHISFIDSKYFDVSSTTGLEGNTVPYLYYLLLEIEQMKKPDGYRKNNHILFNSIYEKTGIEPPERRNVKDVKGQRLKDRKKFIALLNAFKNTGFITDYKKINKGRAIIGVEILDPAIEEKMKRQEAAITSKKKKKQITTNAENMAT